MVLEVLREDGRPAGSTDEAALEVSINARPLTGLDPLHVVEAQKPNMPRTQNLLYLREGERSTLPTLFESHAALSQLKLLQIAMAIRQTPSKKAAWRYLLLP